MIQGETKMDYSAKVLHNLEHWLKGQGTLEVIGVKKMKKSKMSKFINYQCCSILGKNSIQFSKFVNLFV